jgi:hypothetical protein
MARDWLTAGSVERVVDAPPAEVYRRIADVTSTGERSNECRQAEWLPGGPAEPVLGARFRGHNRSGVARWSRVCEVVEARPGEAFAFRTVPERRDLSRRDSTTWRYELLPEEAGTRVRHSYEITTPPLPPFRALFGLLLPQHRDMRPSMQFTLDQLAASVAAGPDGTSTDGID